MDRNNTENYSAVARLRQQIEQEYEAARQGLTGLAQGRSQHTFITARMEHMGVYHVQLAALIGEQEAARMVYEILERSGTP